MQDQDLIEVKELREELVVVSEYCPERAYLEVEIPPDLHHVRRITFRTISQDQGFSDAHISIHGTYNQCYSWFEAAVVTPAFHYRAARKDIQVNVHAHRESREHINSWDTAEASHREWLEAIQPGDRVQVIPRAQHLGWLNYIHLVEITVHGRKASSLSPSIPLLGTRLVPYEMISKSLEDRSAAEDSVFRRLDSSRREIRLLRIACGSLDKPISCTLEYATLDQASYNCLSYHWGDLADTKSLIINRRDESQKTTSKEVRITTNLYNCLRSLQRHDSHQTRALWIDALCINQDDLQERAEQVSIMRAIYSKAEKVIVWLGLPGYRVLQSIEFAVTIQKRYQTANPTDKTSTTDWRTMHDGFLDHAVGRSDSTLLEFEWFRRAWVVQECFNAKSISVLCGDAEISWPLILRINECLNNNQINAGNPMSNTVMPNLFAGLFSHGINPHAESTAAYLTYSTISQSMPILDVIVRSLDLDASDPRDKIFAFLSFGDETRDFKEHHSLIRPDYTKSIRHVFADFTRWWIMRHRSLKILSAIHCSTRRTWQKITSDNVDVNLLDRSSWSLWHDGKTSWAQSSLGLQAEPTYAATHNTEIDLNPVSDPEDPTVLSLTGRHVDRLTRIQKFPFYPLYQRYSNPATTTATETTNEQELRALYEAYISIFDPIDAKHTWRNNVQPHHTGRVKKAHSPRDEAMRVSDHMTAHASHHAQSGRVLFSGAVECCSPCLFVTDNGHVGLCPATAQPGDQIVVLHGAAVPFLLRDAEAQTDRAAEPNRSTDERSVSIGDDRDRPSARYHTVVGECFLKGFMHGRAVQEQRDGVDVYRPERFDLV